MIHIISVSLIIETDDICVTEWSELDGAAVLSLVMQDGTIHELTSAQSADFVTSTGLSKIFREQT